MQNTFKIAISLPREDYVEIEKLCKKTGLGRSALIDQAIRFWLEQKNVEKMIRKYEAGYKKSPEIVANLKAFEKSQLEVFDSKEDWS